MYKAFSKSENYARYWTVVTLIKLSLWNYSVVDLIMYVCKTRPQFKKLDKNTHKRK